MNSEKLMTDEWQLPCKPVQGQKWKDSLTGKTLIYDNEHWRECTNQELMNDMTVSRGK